jgi:hypothetical protein
MALNAKYRKYKPSGALETNSVRWYVANEAEEKDWWRKNKLAYGKVEIQESWISALNVEF